MAPSPDTSGGGPPERPRLSVGLTIPRIVRRHPTSGRGAAASWRSVIRLASRWREPAGQQSQRQGAGAVAGRRADDVIGAALDEPAQLGDQAGQAAPFDILHGEVGDAVDGADGVHRHDVRVLEQAGDLGLELKPLEGLRVHGGGQGQDLQGDPAADGDLARLVHDPHAAPADLADDVKVGEDPARGGVARVGFREGGVIVGNLPERGEPAEGGEQFADLIGMGRVFGGELLDVDRFTGLDLRRAGREELDQLGAHGRVRIAVLARPC